MGLLSAQECLGQSQNWLGRGPVILIQLRDEACVVTHPRFAQSRCLTSLILKRIYEKNNKDISLPHCKRVVTPNLLVLSYMVYKIAELILHLLVKES